MKGVIGRFAVALAAVVAGLAAWSEARSARAVAAGYEQLATFRFNPDRVADPPLIDRVSASVRTRSDEPRRQRALGQYWLGRYDLLGAGRAGGAGGEEPLSSTYDADVLFAAANAAFRAMGPVPAPNLTHLPKLDNVLAGYASVLKADPNHADAAYNYEFVARLREVASRTPPPAPPKEGRNARQGARPPDPDVAPRLAIGDLPAGPTIHGHPGGPPPATRGDEFQVITPMEYGERESQPEASPGGKLPRKG